MLSKLIPLLLVTLFLTCIDYGYAQSQQTSTTTTIPTTTTTAITPAVQPQVQLTPQSQQAVSSTVQSTTLPTDAGIMATTIAAAGGLLLKDRKDKKDLQAQIDQKELDRIAKEQEVEEKNRQIVKILTDISIGYYKIINAAYLYETKTLKQIIDLKASNNPLDRDTLGTYMAEKINQLGTYVVINYEFPMPNMSIPSNQVIQASSVLPENKPPPNHNET